MMAKMFLSGLWPDVRVTVSVSFHNRCLWYLVKILILIGVARLGVGGGMIVCE